MVKWSVSFHLVALGRPFRKENSWISQAQSSSHCFLAAWGSSPFSGYCSGCGCELTSRKQWLWSQGLPLAWEKVGTERRAPKAGQAEGCGRDTYWNKAVMSRKFLLLWILRDKACTAISVTTIASANFDGRRSQNLLRKILIVLYKLELIKARNKLCCSCAVRGLFSKSWKSQEVKLFLQNFPELVFSIHVCFISRYPAILSTPSPCPLPQVRVPFLSWYKSIHSKFKLLAILTPVSIFF